MARIRVGIDLISEKGSPGGIHTYANRLIEALAEASLRAASLGERRLELVALVHDDFRWLFPADSHPCLEVVRSGRRGLGAAARRLLQEALVPRLVRKHRLDLLHSLNNVLPLRAPPASVVTVLDLSPFALPGRFGPLKRAYLRWAVPRSVRRARRVIAISSATREDILRWVPGADPERISVVGLGADPRFRPERDPAAEQALRSRLRLPAEFILTVGAIEPGKNLLGAARALEVLRARDGLSPAWVVAGPPGRGGASIAAALRRGPTGEQVHLLGEVPAPDLPRLYRMAKVFLFPSLHEGFGLPCLEALASGTPAVVSNRSSLPEVVGRAALRVPPDRPEVMASALRRVWRSPELRSLLSSRGLDQASRFSWEEAARGTMRVYEEALGMRLAAAVPAIPSLP